MFIIDATNPHRTSDNYININECMCVIEEVVAAMQKSLNAQEKCSYGDKSADHAAT